MRDLTNPRWIYAKGFLFLVCGCLAALLILMEHPRLKVAVLLVLAIWCFARFYYFAFYVIEHYVDGQYRFAGLLHFCRYLLGWTSDEPRGASGELLTEAHQAGREDHQATHQQPDNVRR